jgi:hypothetical protein
MKFKVILLTAGLMVTLLATLTVNAQVTDSKIKILHSENPGVIKLLYAMEVDESLTVRFLNRAGEFCVDQIKGPIRKGFIKRYDTREINGTDYWVEVSSERMSALYHVTPSKDRKTFVSKLEKTTYNHELVAANRY